MVDSIPQIIYSENMNKKEFIDMDYIKKLPKKDRVWLQKFINKYYYGFKGSRKDADRRNSFRRDIWTNASRIKTVADQIVDFVKVEPKPKERK